VHFDIRISGFIRHWVFRHSSLLAKVKCKNGPPIWRHIVSNGNQDDTRTDLFLDGRLTIEEFFGELCKPFHFRIVAWAAGVLKIL